MQNTQEKRRCSVSKLVDKELKKIIQANSIQCYLFIKLYTMLFICYVHLKKNIFLINVINSQSIVINVKKMAICVKYSLHRFVGIHLLSNHFCFQNQLCPSITTKIACLL